MSVKKKRMHARTGRIIASMIGIVLIMVIVDSLRRDFFKGNTNNCITVEGQFKTRAGKQPTPSSTISFDEANQPTTESEGVKFAGYTESTISSDKISQGNLILISDEHPAPENIQNMVNLSEYKNEYYYVASDEIRLNEDAAEALNFLMADYHESTGLNDFVVYGTTNTYSAPDSFCYGYFPERLSGNTVDFALLGIDDSYIAFDGLDEESWVVKNCTKYGYIVRYPEGKQEKTGEKYRPWHLRYVGRLHAAIMNDKNMCLEEYIEFLKGFNVDSPFVYNFENEAYELYSVKSEGEVTDARLPIAGGYEISGDNIDTYIISCKK